MLVLPAIGLLVTPGSGQVDNTNKGKIITPLNGQGWRFVGEPTHEPTTQHQRRILFDLVTFYFSLFCLLTISLIQIGAKGEVHPLETG
jgi:hypothetical protein